MLCKPLNPMVLLIIIPIQWLWLMAISLGIYPILTDKPIKWRIPHFSETSEVNSRFGPHTRLRPRLPRAASMHRNHPSNPQQPIPYVIRTSKMIKDTMVNLHMSYFEFTWSFPLSLWDRFVASKCWWWHPTLDLSTNRSVVIVRFSLITSTFGLGVIPEFLRDKYTFWLKSKCFPWSSTIMPEHWNPLKFLISRKVGRLSLLNLQCFPVFLKQHLIIPGSNSDFPC